MLTRSSNKLKDIMASSNKVMFVSNEGMDKELVALHDEYLNNTEGISCIEKIMINYIDTWHANHTRPLLQ